MKGMWPKDMPVEVYFLKYAFPCAFITLQRGRITHKKFEELEKAAIKGEEIPREELEKIFAPAMRRLKKLAEETGYPMWSRELVEEYYFKNHNEVIDEGEGDYGKAPAVLRELCKIFPAEVVEVKEGDDIAGDAAVVKFSDGKTRAVNTSLVGDLKPGDRVMIHYGYAAEKLE